MPNPLTMLVVPIFLAWNASCVAQAVSNKPAMACNGVTDDHDALAEALTALPDKGSTVAVLPPGRCRIGASVLVTLRGNQTAVIAGQGPYATELVFSGPGDGLVIRYESQASYTRDASTGAALHVSGLSIVHAEGLGGDGLRIEGDSANEAGVVQPDTILADVVVRGGSGGSGWARGVVLQDVANTALRHLSLMCPNANHPMTAQASGLWIGTTGQRYATRHNLVDLSTWGCGTGVAIGERVQGVAIVNGNFTGGRIGVHWNSVGRQELLAVSNSQFSTFEAGVRVFNVQNVQLTGNTFYNQNAYAAVPGSWVAIDLAEADNSQVTGNGIMGLGRGEETGLHIVNDLAMVAADQPTIVSGNTFSNLNGPALYTANDTSGVLFTGNAVTVRAVPPLAVAPGTAVAAAGNWFAGVPFTAGWPGSPGFTLSVVGGRPVGTNWPQGPAGLPAGGMWVDETGGVHVAR